MLSGGGEFARRPRTPPRTPDPRVVRRLVKTYCLSPIASRNTAAETLDALLPGQRDPWLLTDASGDAMAYFHFDDVEQPGVLTVSADISGRHYGCDAEVVSVLERLRDRVGGEITSDA